MTALERYIKQLNRHKEMAVSRFGDIAGLEKKVIDGSFNWLVDNLDIKKGRVQVPENLGAQMNDFVNSVMSLITKNRSYQSTFTDYLTDLGGIGRAIKDFQIGVNGIDWEKAGVKEVQKAVVTATVESFEGSGLNAGFAQPLKDLMLRNVLGGFSTKDARNQLTEYIASGKDHTGKLARYLEQTAMQGVTAYEGAVSVKLAQTFTYTGFIMAGSLIDTSSPQCRKALDESDNGYLSNDQMEKVIEYAKTLPSDGGLMEGTTLENLPINRLHWGCRHSFTPVIRKKIEENASE
jgi:hypothetical protein